MSTRSLIAKQQKDGKIKSIYCHSDGYPEGGVGETLNDIYNNDKIIDELISLGWLSTLYDNIKPLKEFDTPAYSWRSKEDVKHSFDTPQKNVTTAYHRDRGEKLRIDEFENEKEWMKADFWADYKYLWKDGKWYCDGFLLEEVLKNGYPEVSE